MCVYVILISLYEVFDQTEPFQTSKLGIGIVWKAVSYIGYSIRHFRRLEAVKRISNSLERKSEIYLPEQADCTFSEEKEEGRSTAPFGTDAHSPGLRQKKVRFFFS